MEEGLGPQHMNLGGPRHSVSDISFSHELLGVGGAAPVRRTLRPLGSSGEVPAGHWRQERRWQGLCVEQGVTWCLRPRELWCV